MKKDRDVFFWVLGVIVVAWLITLLVCFIGNEKGSLVFMIGTFIGVFPIHFVCMMWYASIRSIPGVVFIILMMIANCLGAVLLSKEVSSQIGEICTIGIPMWLSWIVSIVFVVHLLRKE